VFECRSIVKSYLCFETSLRITYSHLRNWWLALLHLLSSCLDGMGLFHSMWIVILNTRCETIGSIIFYGLWFAQTWNPKSEKKKWFWRFSITKSEEKGQNDFFNEKGNLIIHDIIMVWMSNQEKTCSLVKLVIATFAPVCTHVDNY
jgi:hypothetical protein